MDESDKIFDDIKGVPVCRANHVETGRPWGKLIKVDTSDEVLLINRENTVGRKRGCDLSFPSNKLVSGEHCKIALDESSGLVWLEDTSTNGTVINMSKLVRKQTHVLQHGDIIHFVYRKSEPQENVAYAFHLINSEQEASHNTSAPVPHSDVTLSVPPVLLTKPPQGLTQEEQLPSTSTSQYCIRSTASVQGSTSHTGTGQQKEDPVSAQDNNNDHLEPECKRRKTNHGSLQRAEVSGPSTQGNADVGSKPQAQAKKTDIMEESLTCIICQDILYDCISLQPCMHTFCAACYSGWMERSSLCPTCRCPVERICKNHILNNLVEAYLSQHPEKNRSEEDLKSMDSRNKITQDMWQPKVERSFSDEEGSSDYLYDFSDNDSDSSDNSQPLVMCRQCPGYRSEVSQVLLTPGSSYWLPGLSVPLTPLPLPTVPKPPLQEGLTNSSCEQPSTSADASSDPVASQQYSCPPYASHLICTCCLQPMPDRQNTQNQQKLFAQQCSICLRYFCHMYWGCPRVGCQGCLARFSDLNLTDKSLDGVLNNNNYESEVLQNYLSVRGKTWRDVLQESLQGLQQGSYTLTDRRISANTVICYCCGLRTFKELAYKYRQNIPQSDLPAAVTSRPDCYWGRNCRTQVKAHHAMKFNHICEQTRFKN
ncbi:E3 ubiquitin-protein ligase CHFR isoform X2 [Boleophthalmus pectinirostris]|uniref:E3 ubiquitin-protein ligase CHFR isoform X2 n=1 Tax=Boleophthalmus pectinirostris TaxID=150288 RepID=UPI00242DBD82|nr:E3 ubiquitin-protein ligase CHFR isoform X2 [Boleophthalmus pectinirostris]